MLPIYQKLPQFTLIHHSVNCKEKKIHLKSSLFKRYYVNRDTLFSYHKASEAFLQRLVGLFVSSHYKNSPDDLLLMSDAPAHHIFVLLGILLFHVFKKI